MICRTQRFSCSHIMSCWNGVGVLFLVFVIAVVKEALSTCRVHDIGAVDPCLTIDCGFEVIHMHTTSQFFSTSRKSQFAGSRTRTLKVNDIRSSCASTVSTDLEASNRFWSYLYTNHKLRTTSLESLTDTRLLHYGASLPLRSHRRLNALRRPHILSHKHVMSRPPPHRARANGIQDNR